MFSFSAVVIALLLIPTFLCAVILHLFFPKNAIRFSDAQLFPVGLGLTLVLNINRLFKFADLLNPPDPVAGENVDAVFVRNALDRAGEIASTYRDFVIVPVGFFIALFSILWILTVISIYFPNVFQPVRFLASRSRELMLHPMGRLTVFAAKREALMLDVLDKNDSLYSGIFLDYFIENGATTGVRLSNVLRYSFKSETARKDEGKGVTGSEHPQDGRPYLLPNDSRMFFPMDQIQNLNFWLIKKDWSQRFDLRREDQQVRFAWTIGLKYSLEHLNMKPVGVLREGEKIPDLSRLARSFKTLNLPQEQLFANLDFEKPKS